MRSFIYLTLLPIFFVSTFAGKKKTASSPNRSAPGMSDMVMHGFKCQKTLYEQKEIEATVKRACNMYFNNKKTVGVTRYPMISKDSEDDKNFKIVFPLSSGSYFGWRAPGNHFVRMDPKCSSAEVVYQVRQKPQQASKHWCRLPNCFARGGKIYNSCTLLWERSHKGQEYFNIHPLDLLLPRELH
ncbi:hypothetical protein K3495_g1543 [Podosphaera aphanis]|nr:hypothetical protein K3495_g1543 [Podosphaera aphanis]